MHCRGGWVKGWVEWMEMRTEEWIARSQAGRYGLTTQQREVQVPKQGKSPGSLSRSPAPAGVAGGRAVGSASPAAKGPRGLTKRATLIGCEQPRGRQLRPRTANRCIDM